MNSSVSDVMIDKRKGQQINELRMIELIEADLRSLMRIFLGLRIDEGYEKHEILSKHDYRFRKAF